MIIKISIQKQKTTFKRLISSYLFVIIERKKNTRQKEKTKSLFYTKTIVLSSLRIIVRLEYVIRIVVIYIYVLVVADSFTEVDRNEAKPIAGNAKLIDGFVGEYC